jgi:microcystin-dependent protein
MLGFGFAPRGYAWCDGRLLPIAQNQALFSVLGTTYGGNGTTTFALPDLRGRTPLGMSQAYPEGMQSGSENVTLLPTQLPAHIHAVEYTSQSSAARSPANGMYGNTGTSQLYAPGSNPQVPLNPMTAGLTGGGEPHPNMQPFTVLNFCIAVQGIFPSRS